MKVSKAVLWLASLTGVLAFFTSGIGLFWQGTGAPFEFISVHNTPVTIYGQGLYYYDSLLSGAGFRGTDLITLMISLPLLIFAIFSYGRGSLRGGVLLAGMLSYFLYNAASLAFGVAYNNLMLLYIAMLSVSLTAFILVLMSINPQTLRDSTDDRMPRRAIARFLIFAGVVLTFVWLSGIIPALLQNQIPAVVGHYTTIVTYPLDLGIIAPYAILTGVLLLRGNPLAYLFVSPMLVLCSLIGIVVLSQTVFQLQAGVPLTVAEIVIYAVSFMTMALASGWFTLAFFRSIPSSEVGVGRKPVHSH